MEQDASWTKEEEKQWKKQIKELFAAKLNEAHAQYGDALDVGNRLGEILRSVERDAVRLVVPRAARKWASPENRELWEEIIRDEQKLFELRAIGVSIANTLRPLAGNTFAEWIAVVLNECFSVRRLSLGAITKGELKKRLSNRMVVKIGDQASATDLKPDIDIVVIDTVSDRPIAILSAKTTLAERIMQTINWKRYRDQLPEDVRALPIYLVTAWETFEGSSANRNRAQELDGVYVCNTEANFEGVIKPFSQLAEDLQRLL